MKNVDLKESFEAYIKDHPNLYVRDTDAGNIEVERTDDNGNITTSIFDDYQEAFNEVDKAEKEDKLDEKIDAINEALEAEGFEGVEVSAELSEDSDGSMVFEVEIEYPDDSANFVVWDNFDELSESIADNLADHNIDLDTPVDIEDYRDLEMNDDWYDDDIENDGWD